MTGRPSTYTDELADAICLLIAGGESLVAISRRDDMPGFSTVTQWLRNKLEFAARYALARESQADFLADQIVEIADDSTIPPDDRRVRIDARKWHAGKLRPKVYGDKTTTEITGKEGGPVQFEHRSDEELNARILELAAKAGTRGASDPAGGKETPPGKK